MKAPDSFWNPNRWYDFHHYHGHKTKDCVTLRIKVNELLKKGHLREFLSDKAKNLLNKETNNKTPETAPASPPRQDRVIHVISSGSEVSDVSHAAAKKSTRNAKNGEEDGRTKHLLLGTDEIMKQTSGEVTLPVYAEGINMSTKFLVVECKSSYNMILGRPWIHDM
uniref:Uncharacterized protein n=1 Tax=Brassica oleracea TaxID=3712 RepID=A0A3P6BFF8_BRAOL|nr:unnamed protein product [Brassica oleracea]